MSHAPSMDCPNCGRSINQGEVYCYFCELDIEKLKKQQHAHGNGHSHVSHSGKEIHENPTLPEKKALFSRIISKLTGGKRREKQDLSAKMGKN